MQMSFFEKIMVTQLIKKSLALAVSHSPAIGPYPKPEESNPQSYTLILQDIYTCEYCGM
jgi:hypothetical protein